jgi:serine/threonine-protein kinase
MTDGKVVPLHLAGIRPLAMLDGMLVYLQADGQVMAVALEVPGRRTTTTPVPVHDPVEVSPQFNGNSGIFVSGGGGLVASRVSTRGQLGWVSRRGTTEVISPAVRDFEVARLSPDERRIAVVIADGARRDVWIYDRALATFSRLTSVETVYYAEWSPDGSRIVFATAGREDGFAVWSQPVSGGSPAVKLFDQADASPSAIMAPDGKSLLINRLLENFWGLIRVPLDSPSEPRTYLRATKADVHSPQFSPDGKWVTYLSRESGRDEVYVQSFPDPSAKLQVSSAGGIEPAWSRDGRRIYYRSGSSLLEARLSLAPTLALVARETVLADATALGSVASPDRASYQATRDDKRFLGVLRSAGDYELVVSPNWIMDLRRRLAEIGPKH